MKRLFQTAALLSVFLCGAAAAQDNEIRIGIMMPLSGTAARSGLRRSQHSS